MRGKTIDHGVAYFVQDGHTLGYTMPGCPDMLCPLSGRHDPSNGAVSTQGTTLTPATLADFERFRVDPKGHIE